jgi:hypothetical protein
MNGSLRQKQTFVRAIERQCDELPSRDGEREHRRCNSINGQNPVIEVPLRLPRRPL